MAKPRTEFHEELCKVLGSRQCYFQAPSNNKMKYPSIVYDLSEIDLLKADDNNYLVDKCYDVTIIDRDPDSEILDRVIATFNKCRFNRHFTNDNLHHYVFQIYY